MDYATFKQRMRDEIMPMLARAADPPAEARAWYAALTPAERDYLHRWNAEQEQALRDLADAWIAVVQALAATADPLWAHLALVLDGAGL